MYGSYWFCSCVVLSFCLHYASLAYLLFALPVHLLMVCFALAGGSFTVMWGVLLSTCVRLPVATPFAGCCLACRLLSSFLVVIGVVPFLSFRSLCRVLPIFFTSVGVLYSVRLCFLFHVIYSSI